LQAKQFESNFTFSGPSIKDSLDTARESKEQLALLAQLFDAGKLQPVIDKTFDFKDMQAAHAYVDSGRKKGNVVVQL
jgi:NADPH:quinone reductase-like Zn-dependent oxidoreductase